VDEQHAAGGRSAVVPDLEQVGERAVGEAGEVGVVGQLDRGGALHEGLPGGEERGRVDRLDAREPGAQARGEVGGQPRPVLGGRTVDGEGERRRRELGDRTVPSGAHRAADGGVARARVVTGTGHPFSSEQVEIRIP
jgi:hypothetical protein